MQKDIEQLLIKYHLCKNEKESERLLKKIRAIQKILHEEDTEEKEVKENV